MGQGPTLRDLLNIMNGSTLSFRPESESATYMEGPVFNSEGIVVRRHDECEPVS